jgi:hypothetical protein
VHPPNKTSATPALEEILFRSLLNLCEHMYDFKYLSLKIKKIILFSYLKEKNT